MEIDDLIPNFELEEEKPIEQPIVEGTPAEDTPPITEDEPKQYEKGDASAITFFEELKQRGYVDDGTEFDGSWEKLDNYLETFPQKVLDSVVQSLPDVSKDVMKFIATAGQNITKDEMQTFFKTYFEQESAPEIKTADDARSYLTKVYKEQGLTDRATNVMLDDLEDDSKLEETAKKFLEKQQNKTTQLIEAKQKEIEQQTNQIKQRTLQIEEELQATKWKPEKIASIKQMLVNNNINDRLRAIVADPKTFVQFADILSNFDITKKTFNFEKYINQLNSTQVLAIKDRVEKNMQNSSTMNTKSTEKNPNSDYINTLVPILD